jgi:hypothetical protein
VAALIEENMDSRGEAADIHVNEVGFAVSVDVALGYGAGSRS